MISNQLQLLYKLQEIEGSEAELKRKLSKIFEERKTNCIEDSIAKLNKNIQENKEAFEKLNNKINENEKRSNKYHLEIRQMKNRAYSGKCTNQKELTTLHEKMEILTVKVNGLDNETIESMEKAENIKNKLDKARNQILQMRKELEESKLKFNIQTDRTNDALQKLYIRKQEILSAISEDFLNLYEKVKRLKDTPVALIEEGGRCSGCKMSVPYFIAYEAKEYKTIVYCESCGRILLGKNLI